MTVPTPSAVRASPTDRLSQPVAELVVHPAVVVSLVVLVVNDHWGKARWPGLVTGKVSDVAGLVFFPVLLAVVVDEVRRVSGRGGDPTPVALLRWATVVTAVGFTAVKSSRMVADWYSDALGWIQRPPRALTAVVTGSALPDHAAIVVRADPWDLLTLPAVLVALWVADHRATPVPP